MTKCVYHAMYVRASTPFHIEKFEFVPHKVRYIRTRLYNYLYLSK